MADDESAAGTKAKYRKGHDRSDLPSTDRSALAIWRELAFTDVAFLKTPVRI